MKSIQDRLTPQQRAPGSGSTSNFDAEMFKNALFGPDKPKQANQNIITAITARQQSELDMQQFMSDYLDANGHLNGADRAWQQYLDANPIFDPKSATPENMAINPDRKTYQEYFSGAQTQAMPQAPQVAQPAQSGRREQIIMQMQQRGRTPEQIQQFLQANGL
jgi:hypothetical protein